MGLYADYLKIKFGFKIAKILLFIAAIELLMIPVRLIIGLGLKTFIGLF